MNQTYLSAIKSFEGFTPQAKWDYAQHSNGYGTKALYPGEAISPEEAERRFAAEIAVARDIVEKHAQGWDEGTKAALTSLTFNAGTRWISSGLGDAVRNGDIEGVRERFVQYSKAQGEVLPGLLKRRLAEVDWIGSGTEGAAPAAKAATLTAAAPADQPSVQPTLTAASSPIAAPDATTAPPTAMDRREVAAALQDHLTGVSPDVLNEVRNAQSASALITLLFDLQMRAAGAEAKDETKDGSAASADAPTTSVITGRPQQAV
jgi:lysozyme